MRESGKGGSNPVEDAARAHPEFEKWNNMAEETEQVSEEDAMEHRAVTAEELAHMRAKIFWLQRLSQSRDTGFRAAGEHRQRAQSLASEFGIGVTEAENIMEQSQADVEGEYGRMADIWKMREGAMMEIAELEEKIEEGKQQKAA